MSLLLVALTGASLWGDYSRFELSAVESDRITSAEYGHCTNKARSNSEAVQCIYDEWDNVDRQLNESYRAALARMPTRRMRELLRNAQRRWVRQVKECSVEDAGGHTPYELALHQCEIDELIRRTVWLHKLAHR